MIEILERRRGLELESIWIDGLLFKKLKAAKIRVIGDLHGREENEIVCGIRSVEELQALVLEINAGNYDVSDFTFEEAVLFLVHHVDGILLGQKPTTIEIFEKRTGEGLDRPQTLDEIGGITNMTRQRVEQVEKKVLAEIKKRFAPKINKAVEIICVHCTERCIPLTDREIEALLVENDVISRFSGKFYALTLHLAFPCLPLWACMPGGWGNKPHNFDIIRQWLEETLERGEGKMSWQACFNQCRQDICDLELLDFIRALITYEKCRVEVTADGVWTVFAKQLTVGSGVHAVLEQSDAPLTTHEINQQGRIMFRERWAERDDRGLEMILSKDRCRFFRLQRGNRWGLKKHIQTTPELWPALRDKFASVVRAKRIPITTNEFLKLDDVQDYATRTDGYELAAILMLDEQKRFIQTGRKFLFGLRDSSVMESRDGRNPTLKEVIVEVLRDYDQPLRRSEILERAGARRCFASTSLPNTLRELQNEGRIQYTTTGYYELVGNVANRELSEDEE